MQIDVITLFPELFSSFSDTSILSRNLGRGLLSINLYNLRHYGVGKHRITDEPPYGGGGGMVLKPQPVFEAVESILKTGDKSAIGEDMQPELLIPIILLTPQGKVFDQAIASKLSHQQRLLFICGRYEGVDERIRSHLVTDELSIGDYILSGGELAAMVIIDAVARLLPGALGAEDAAQKDSFSESLLEGPHYTRPKSFKGWDVPEVLRSGHKKKIQRWRREQALRRTWQRRPELLLKADLDDEDSQFLGTLADETNSTAEMTD